MKRLYTLLLLLVITAGTAWGQVTLATFNFENNLNAEAGAIGSPTMTASAAVSYFGGATGNAASFSSANGKYFELTINTTGYENISVSWKSRTSSATSALELTGDSGSGFGSVLVSHNLTTSFTTSSHNFAAAFDDGTGVKMRWTATVSATQTVRIDEVVVTGDLIEGSGPSNPASFTATTASPTQINLEFTQNVAVDDVMIAFNTENTFGDPTGAYVAEDAIVGGGTVLYVGDASPFNHTGLTGNTQYFYKAWSTDGADYSIGLTANATTLKVEPSNTVSDLEVASGVNSVIVRWTDPSTGTLPDGILVKISSSGLGSITDPEDGTAASDDLDLTDGSAVANISYGTEYITFTGLTQGTTYSAKVYPYTNSDTEIDYKLTSVQSDEASVLSYVRVFRETFPTASTTLFNVYASTDNASFDFDGDGDVRTSSASTGYTNASGTGNAFFTTSPKNLVISGINTTGLSNFSILFGMNSSANVGLVVEASSDGITYDTLSYNTVASSGWKQMTIAGALIPTAANVRLRFTNNSSSIRLDDLELYTEGAEASLTGTAGWRLLSSPVSGSTYADLLGPIWTQGATGADATNGTPNVFWSEGSSAEALSRSNVTDLTTAVPAGRGFAVYVYNDDNYNAEGGTTWPKTLSVTGSENAANVVYTPSWTSGSEYAIAGNPFASTIQFDDLTLGADLADKVWVYDPSIDDYETRSSGVGDFDGLVAPFQGFWVEYTSAASALTFPASAKTTGGTFYGKTTEFPRIVLRLENGDRGSNTWVTFRDEALVGIDKMDAVKFAPMSATYLQLFSTIEDAAHDINFMPTGLVESIEIPISYRSSSAGTLELMVDQFLLPDGWLASLMDVETGETYALDSDFKLNFEGAMAKMATQPENSLVAAAAAPRFVIIIDPVKTTSTKDDGRGTMTEFALEQNYPNPFNPSTVIGFQVGTQDLASVQVSLKVYDMLGREVAVLVNGVMSAGSHSVNFDASDITSGVYLYKLEAGGQTITKRMTLIK